MNKLNRFMIRRITDYQSSKRPDHIKRCKYFPTCSEYSKQCYENYNFFSATALTVWRILRCNPLSKGGFDPIPKEKKLLKQQKFEINNIKNNDHQDNS